MCAFKQKCIVIHEYDDFEERNLCFYVKVFTSIFYFVHFENAIQKIHNNLRSKFSNVNYIHDQNQRLSKFSTQVNAHEMRHKNKSTAWHEQQYFYL